MASDIKDIIEKLNSAYDHPEIKELFDFINDNIMVDLKKLQSQYTLEQLIEKVERIAFIYDNIEEEPSFKILLIERSRLIGTYSHGMNYA